GPGVAVHLLPICHTQCVHCIELDVAAVLLGLAKIIGNVITEPLRFNGCDRPKADEEHVIGPRFLLLVGVVARPFGNRAVLAGFGPSTASVIEQLRIDLPAALAQLAVDEDASLLLGKTNEAAGLLSLPPNLGDSLLHVGQWESLLLRDLLVECLTRARELGLCLERHLLVDLALFVDLLSELGLLLCFLLFKREQTLVTVVGEMCLIQGCLKLRDLRLQISKLR